MKSTLLSSICKLLEGGFLGYNNLQTECFGVLIFSFRKPYEEWNFARDFMLLPNKKMGKEGSSYSLFTG